MLVGLHTLNLNATRPFGPCCGVAAALIIEPSPCNLMGSPAATLDVRSGGLGSPPHCYNAVSFSCHQPLLTAGEPPTPISTLYYTVLVHTDTNRPPWEAQIRRCDWLRLAGEGTSCGEATPSLVRRDPRKRLDSYSCSASCSFCFSVLVQCSWSRLRNLASI